MAKQIIPRLLTQEQLKQLLSFDAESGKFYRKKSAGANAKAGDLAGRIDRHGYRAIQIDGIKYPEHRLVFLYVTGRFPDGNVDHINHCRSDNRMENLRVVTHAVNQKNRRLSNNNTSGVNGVVFRTLETRKIHACYMQAVFYQYQIFCCNQPYYFS